MKKLIDVVCPECGPQIDVWSDDGSMPLCECGLPTERLWFGVKAPGITPQGTRPERNTDKPSRPRRVDTRAIAVETKQEIEQKWLRYSDEKVAEQVISREINHKAGMADEAGNLLPPPKPAPITFAKPEA